MNYYGLIAGTLLLTLFSCRVSDDGDENLADSSSSASELSSSAQLTSSSSSIQEAICNGEWYQLDSLREANIAGIKRNCGVVAENRLRHIKDSIIAEARCNVSLDCRVTSNLDYNLDFGYSSLNKPRSEMQTLVDSLIEWRMQYSPWFSSTRMGIYLFPVGCQQGYCQFASGVFTSNDNSQLLFLDSLEATATCHTSADCQTVQGSCSALGYSLLVHDSSAAQKTIDSLDRANVRNEAIHGCKVDRSVYTASGCVDGFCRFQWTVQP